MKLIGKLILGGLAYVVGMVLSGMLTAALHIHGLPPVPGDASPQTQFLMTLALAPILALSLVPLARGLRGSWLERCLAVGGLVFVAIGLNTMIELIIFSDMLPDGNLSFSVFFILPSLLIAAAITSRTGQSQSSSLAPSGITSWMWRLTLAWLSFPIIYFLIGMCIAPIVVPYYNAGIAGLKIPPVDVIIRTQLVRSLIFLAASLPAVFLWTKSRTNFILAMGLVHAMTVGVIQLAQASFLPTVLRVTHSLEITTDSFMYAAVLGLLFVRGEKSAEPSLIKSVAA